MSRFEGLVLIAAMAMLTACVSQGPVAPEPYDHPAAATSAVQELKSPSGKTYRYFDTGDPGGQSGSYKDRQAREAERESLFTAQTLAGKVAAKDVFEVSRRSRGVAKTSIVRKKPEFYPKLTELLATLPKDSEMLKLGIDRDTPRVPEEMRNVATCAWIVATKREDDADYHMIVSNGAKTFMNVEISGIPDKANVKDRQQLIEVRSVFEDFVVDTARTTGTYKGWGDPVLVYLEGPLFYDIEHKPGVVGPQGSRPRTSWEIHPVAQIEFESKRCQ